MSIGIMVIELREFNDKKKKKKKNNMDKMQKLNFVIIWPKNDNLMYHYVHSCYTQTCTHRCTSVGTCISRCMCNKSL